MPAYFSRAYFLILQKTGVCFPERERSYTFVYNCNRINMIDKTDNTIEQGFNQVCDLITLRKARAYQAVNKESILCN